MPLSVATCPRLLSTSLLLASLLTAGATAQNRTEVQPPKTQPPKTQPPTAEAPKETPQAGDATEPPVKIPAWQEDPRGLPANAPVTPPTGEWDALRPFRKPTEQVPAPDRVYAALRLMEATARRHPDKVRYDQLGREVVDHPDWQAAYERLQNMEGPSSLSMSPGYLVRIIRDSFVADDRAIAFYGAFYFSLPTWVIQTINYIPGEPRADIRAEMLPRAVTYLRVHLSRSWADLSEDEQKVVSTYRSTADLRDGSVQPKDKLAFAPDLDPRPFLAVWDLDDKVAIAQSLWFFKELAGTHPELVKVWLFGQGDRVRALTAHEDNRVRAEALGLVAGLSGKPQPTGEAAGDAGARQKWLQEALDAAFPPAPCIEQISNGLVILRRSAELDGLLEKGRNLLSRGTVGEPTSGKDKEGWRYWGLKLRKLEPEFKALGIPKGAVLTSVNGRPVRNQGELLRVIQEEAKAKTTLIVEWVFQEQRRATEFRLR